MTTKVINIKSGQPYDQYIGRAGHGQDGYFGNPFVREPNESPGATLHRFKGYFYDRLAKDVVFRARVHALKGKTLACFCKPNACHGDIIVEYLNNSVT